MDGDVGISDGADRADGADGADRVDRAEWLQLAVRIARDLGRPDVSDPAQVLSERGDVLVVAVGDVVVKRHQEGTDPDALARRLAVAAHDTSGALVAPLQLRVHRHRGRLLTTWPRVHVLGVDDLPHAPWARLGELAARLHAQPPPASGAPVPASAAPLPASGRLQPPPVPPPARSALRVADAVARLRALAAPAASPPLTHAAHAVLAAAAALPAWARATSPEAAAPEELPATVVHGDLHLGQLGRGDDGRWRLLDVDDLGTGPAAWDLARPAAWYAAGVLDPADWAAFLDAYRGVGGPAVPRDGDPWPWLDAVARALVVQTAARAVIEAIVAGRELDRVGESFVRTSAQIGAEARSAHREAHR
ncbi:MAG: hypothetical protein U0Q15_10385 [Kineosporiaceae bacterium]